MKGPRGKVGPDEPTPTGSAELLATEQQRGELSE
jgi:hypothetical protein